MSENIINFPDKDELAFIHIAPHVRKIALDRSYSAEIADRVVEVVRQAHKRSVPVKVNFGANSVEGLRDDAMAHIYSIVGGMLAEMTLIATDAEMLAVDHDPSPGPHG